MIDPTNPFNQRPITSYAQNLEDVMLWRALGHVEAGFYIDVGANDPVIDSVTLAFYERGWRGINIEPIPALLQSLQAARPEDINLGCAVSDQPGEMTLWQMQGHGLSTLDEDIARGHLALGHEGQRIPVPVQTLAQVCEQHAMGRDIHFLKVDVEGFEAQVLAGADFARFRPWVLVIEATLPLSQVTAHEAWEPLLTGQGYTFAYTDGLNRFYVAAEQAQLLPALAYPPNVFDQYTRVRERTALEQVAHWRAQAVQLQAQLQTQAEQLAAERERVKASQPPVPGRARRRLLVDVTGHSPGSVSSGMRKMVNKLMSNWLSNVDTDVQIVPVRWQSADQEYVLDAAWEREYCGRGTALQGSVIHPSSGDTLAIIHGDILQLADRGPVFGRFRNAGVFLVAVLLDILPLQWRHCCPTSVSAAFDQGIRAFFQVNKIVAISEKVAMEWKNLAAINRIDLPENFQLSWFHLGSDFAKIQDASALQSMPGGLQGSVYCMTVSNICPRKGYAQTLDAFEYLWAKGSSVRWVVVGRHLWMMDEFCGRLANHPELQRRLFWYQDIDDAHLSVLYQSAAGLIAPSLDEGFGLPLVEAMRHGCPVLARDIPVFREISCGMAQFFSGDSAEDLAQALEQWLATAGQRPRPDPLHPGLKTWAQAAANLQHLVLADAVT